MDANVAFEKAMSTSPNVLNFLGWVKIQIDHHEFEGNYSGELSKGEQIYLESKGYTIKYNDACLWFEVNWLPFA